MNNIEVAFLTIKVEDLERHVKNLELKISFLEDENLKLNDELTVANNRLEGLERDKR